MDEDANRCYYQERKESYLKDYARMFRSADRVLPRYLGPEGLVGLDEEVRKRFGENLSLLPDIGGDSNPLTSSLVGSALLLGYMQALERRGLSVTEIGRSVNEVYADVFARLPALFRYCLRRSEFSRRHMKRLREYAASSQRRLYPGDWVLEHLDGDGVAFDYGTNYTKCAVLDFFRSVGAEAYMPYVCVLDLTYSHVVGTGLERSGTLYYGAPCCDFRFKKGRASQSGLPLAALPEYRNRLRDV